MRVVFSGGVSSEQKLGVNMGLQSKQARTNGERAENTSPKPGELGNNAIYLPSVPLLPFVRLSLSLPQSPAVFKGQPQN